MESARPEPHNVRGLYRAEYEQLVDLGVFENVRVELLEGQLIEMSAQGEAHATLTGHLAHLLHPLLLPNMRIRQHSGLRAGMKSKPEPDLVIIPYRPGYYHADEPFLVVEVADSSLHNDRGIKAAIYAAVGVQEYWVIDVVHEQLIVHTQPTVHGYKSIVIRERGDSVRPLALPEVMLAITDILDP